MTHPMCKGCLFWLAKHRATDTHAPCAVLGVTRNGAVVCSLYEPDARWFRVSARAHQEEG